MVRFRSVVLYQTLKFEFPKKNPLAHVSCTLSMTFISNFRFLTQTEQQHYIDLKCPETNFAQRDMAVLLSASHLLITRPRRFFIGRPKITYQIFLSISYRNCIFLDNCSNCQFIRGDTGLLLVFFVLNRFVSPLSVIRFHSHFDCC